MLTILSVTVAVIALAALIYNPIIGIPLVLIARPFVDTEWASPILLGLKLTEIFSAAVPLILVGHFVLSKRGRLGIQRAPLKTIWIIYSVYIFLFSATILYHQGWVTGANIFFRYINGFVGFLMLQAYFVDRQRMKYIFWAMILAGLFPVAVGLYQIATGMQWTYTHKAGLVRNIGLYHDAINVKVYSLQTIMGIFLYLSISNVEKWKRIPMFTYGAACLAVLFKAYSKSGVAILVVWAAVWAIYRRKRIILVTLFAISGLLITIFANQIVDELLLIYKGEIGAVTGEYGIEKTFSGRWYTWRVLLEEWLSKSFFRKMFGTGQVALSAHNDYLQMIFHGGLVGLCIYVTLLLLVAHRLIRNVTRKADPLNIAGIMALAMWLIDSIGLVPSAYPGYQWFIWGLIGLSLRVSSDATIRQKRKSEKSNGNQETTYELNAIIDSSTPKNVLKKKTRHARSIQTNRLKLY